MDERRKALITGGSARVGRAMALDLAATGWDIAVHYRGESDTAEATAREIRDLGGRAVTVHADLLNADEVAKMIGQATAGLGGALSLLINNASLFENDNIGTITAESWDRAMDSNLRAHVMLTQDFAAQAPAAAKDDNGEPVAQAVVINIIDQRVLKPTPAFQSYFLAKSGLHAFTRTAAQALAPNIRVAGIGPGPTLPAIRQSDEHFRKQRAACLLQRGSDPEDIVNAMRFIIANKAFTGQMLAIDGGQHLNWETPDVIGTGE